eukprot:scaffold6807_cov220-Amphora_coffeaeformis.AAC.16
MVFRRVGTRSDKNPISRVIFKKSGMMQRYSNNGTNDDFAKYSSVWLQSIDQQAMSLERMRESCTENESFASSTNKSSNSLASHVNTMMLDLTSHCTHKHSDTKDESVDQDESPGASRYQGQVDLFLRMVDDDVHSPGHFDFESMMILIP